jgi:Flp pilus assembly protein TadG
MIGFFRRLFKDRRGNALVMAGAFLPLVVGASGLATDTIQWTLWKRQLQRAADSAAIAGVYDREQAAGGTSTANSAVTHDLATNLHTWMGLLSGYPQVTFPANSGVMTNQVHVTLAIQQPLPFSSMFMTASPTIIANSTAASVPAPGDPCVQALVDSGKGPGIDNSGNTTIDAPDCILFSNLGTANSAIAGGSSSVTAKAIAAVGGIAQSNNWHVQQYLPYSPSIPDPYADVDVDPADMHCVNDTLDDKTNIAALAPGINCFNGLSVGSNKTLDLTGKLSGPIYINGTSGGGVDLKGSFTCASCTIILTNSDPTSNAIPSFSSNAQASNNITAPQTGPYAGIAVYQDRRATGGVDKINGGSGNVITGALYFPKDTLWINGSGTANSLCTKFVAWKIVFTGNSGLKLKSANDPACVGSGMDPGNGIRMVRLVA